MEELCSDLEVAGSQCIAVGDGPAAIALFARAGLSVAVCLSEERVHAAARVILEDGDLTALVPTIEDYFSLPTD
jgi:hydroxymethylpyrimidine pyrophosphatase-like HAD family hydrolase